MVVSTGASQRRRFPSMIVVAVTLAGQGWLPHFRMLVKTIHEYPPRTTGLNVGSTDELRSAGSGGSLALARRIGVPEARVAMKRLPSSGSLSLGHPALQPVGVVPA